MRNFIEVDINKVKTLININHIVKVSELKRNEILGCEIFLTNSASIYEAKSFILTDKNTKYEIYEKKTRFFTPISYKELKQKIQEATL